MTRDDASETAERIRNHSEVLTNLEHWSREYASGRYPLVWEHCREHDYPYIVGATRRLEHGVYALHTSRDRWRIAALVALAATALVAAFVPVW